MSGMRVGGKRWGIGASTGRMLSAARLGLPAVVLLVGLVLALIPAAASAESLCTDTWVGPAEGPWTTAADWSMSKVPSSTDVACIGAGKVVTVGEGTNHTGIVQGEGGIVISAGSLEVGASILETSVIGSITLNGGTLTGAGAVYVSSSFAWNSKSTLSGSGSLVVEKGASAKISGVGEKFFLAGRTFVNESTLTFAKGYIEMSEGAVLRNTGTFTMNAEGAIEVEPVGAAPSYVNTGTMQKTEGTGTGLITVSFENKGTVSAKTGRLEFKGGGSSNGTWQGVESGAVSFVSGSYTFAGGTWSGSLYVSGASLSMEGVEGSSANITGESGTLTVAGGSMTVNSYTLSGGTLGGAGSVYVSSALSWNRPSTMSGSGSLIVKKGATGTISDTGEKFYLAKHTIVNEGALSFLKGYLEASEGAVIKNIGTFTFNAEGGLEVEAKGAAPQFINNGTVQKTEGIGTALMGVPFENKGTVTSKTGKIEFKTGGSSTSGSTWRSTESGELSFASGSYTVVAGTWSGTFNITGAAVSAESVASTGATITDSAGSLTVTSGSMTVNGFTLSGGTLALSSGSLTASNCTESAGTLSGTGSLTVTSSFLWSGSSTASGSGSLVVQKGASAKIYGAGEHFHLAGRRFVNETTLNFGKGYIVMSEGATLVNTGTFDMNAEGAIEVEAKGAEPLFVNRGTVQKTEGTGSSPIEVGFENYGTIQSLTGKLEIKHPIAVATPETQYGSLSAGLEELIRIFCGDPVDCVTGNYTESQTDFAVGGRGVGLDLKRTYNAQAAAKAASAGMFGYGWSSSFSDRLVVESSAHIATLYEATGGTITFTESGGVFTAPARSGDTLTGSAEAGYTVTRMNQTKFVFSGSNRRLESEEDRNGNKTTLSYNEKGQLATVTDPAGGKIKLAYNAGGQVETAEDPMGHVVKYAYESGNLTSVTLPGETSPNWRFKYDASHRITSMINGLSGETVNTYDSSNRVISQKDPLGHVLKWEYEPFRTKLTNEATGAVTVEQFNSADLVTSITHGYGTSSATTKTISYNEHNEPTAITDGNGHTTKYEYDSAGNRTKTIDPEGHETSWTYNSTNDVTSITRPNGEKTTIERDTHGNATLISRPAPGSTTQETHFEYNSHGEATSQTDPLGRKSTYEYDSQGDLTSETDPEGDKRTHAYNEDSQETSNVSPRGNVEGGEPSRYRTTIERDAQGRPIKITDPLGHETHYAYDADGNVTATKDPNGHETKTTYNAVNLPTKVTEPNGTITETSYDGANQVTSQIDGNKHTTSYKRNVLEQVTEITDPLLRKTTKTYDLAGNLATLKDAASRTTTYTYNKDNQLTKLAYSDGVTPTVEYEYDSDGNRTAMTDGTGKTTYTYDQLDRLTKTKDGHGNTVGYEYDLANEQAKITYPNGKTVEHAYDKAGRLHSVTDWLEHTTSFAYDQNSNLTATTFPTGTGGQDTYAYNEADQPTEAHMTKGEEVLASLTYTRDSNGQVTKTVAKGLPGAETTEYTYDENERLTKAGTTTYEYDAANNPTKTPGSTNTFDAADQLTEGTGVKYSYDEMGERTKATPTSGPATTYGYNQAGDLTSVARPEEGETPKIEDTYAYNGDGLRVSQTVSGTTHYLALDATDGTILSDEANSYIAGPGGVPVEQIDGESKALYLHHDQQGSTRMLTGASGTVEATMSFDAYGNPAGSTGTATTPLRYDGQYTNTDTGLLDLRARSYDPATAQFTSVDPIVQMTQAPYTYAGDNPLTLADPSGLCSINPFSSSSCISEAGEEVVHVAEEHPVAAGIGLGVAAVVTGGAAIVVEGGAAATIGLGGASVVAGAGAAALDTSKCVNGDAAACVGAGLGLASVGLSGPELAAGLRLIEDASAYRALAGLGVVFGGYSTLYDLLSQDPYFLEELLC